MDSLPVRSAASGQPSFAASRCAEGPPRTLPGSAAARYATPTGRASRMTDLHADMIVVDGLIISKWSRSVFEEMRKGGLTAANCTCSVWEGFEGTMRNIADWKRWLRENADILVPVYSTADIRRAKQEGRTGII